MDFKGVLADPHFTFVDWDFPAFLEAQYLPSSSQHHVSFTNKLLLLWGTLCARKQGKRGDICWKINHHNYSIRRHLALAKTVYDDDDGSFLSPLLSSTIRGLRRRGRRSREAVDILLERRWSSA